MMLNNINSECLPACEVTCMQPCAYSRSLEPCVASCGDSRAVVYAPPVVLTFPGPTLSSCSQESIVGTSFPQLYGALTPYSSDESYGMKGSFGSGGSFGYGGSSGIGSSFGPGGSFGCGDMSGIRGSFGPGGSFGCGDISGIRESFGPGGSFGCGDMSGIRGSFGSGRSFGYGGSSGMGGCYSMRSYSSNRGSRLGNCGSF